MISSFRKGGWLPVSNEKTSAAQASAPARGVTRRGFITAAGAAAVSGVAATELSGCGEGRVVSGAGSAAANPVTQRAVPSWLGTAPEVDESAITETVDVDVVVVGLGTAGVPAVISAAENGARVLGIDSQAEISNVREDIGAINSSLQKASFAEFPQFEIDPMEAMEDIVRYANGFVSCDLVKLWAEESGPTIDWLTQICERNGDFKMKLACGRDRAFIQERLVVSRNTVKAHVKHVYAKLGIHSHQELIALVERGSSAR